MFEVWQLNNHADIFVHWLAAVVNWHILVCVTT